MRTSLVSILTLAFLATAPTLSVPAAAQERPDAGDEVRIAAINAALGALTVGAWRVVRRERLTDGMLPGAAGGVLGYAGKRVAVERFFGAGLLGREVAAVGGSMVWNAAEGRGAVERVVLPLGPVRLYLTPRERVVVRARVDLAGVVYAGYHAFQPDHVFDLEESLSAGAPVFRVYEGTEELAGEEDVGTIFLYYPADRRPLSSDERGELRATRGHERVHVLQDDQLFLYVVAPLEDRIFALHPAAARLHRHVDLGLAVPLLWRAAASLIPYDDQPWEAEAETLSRVP